MIVHQNLIRQLIVVSILMFQVNNLSGQKYKNGGVRCNINGGISIFHSNKVINEFGGEYTPLLNYNSQISFDLPLKDRSSLIEIGLNFKYFHYKSYEYPNSNVGISYRLYGNKFYFLNFGYGRQFKFLKKLKIIPKFCIYVGSYEFYESDEITNLFNGTSYSTSITHGSGFNFFPGFSVSAPLHFDLNRYLNIVFSPIYDYWLNFNGIPKHTGFFNLSFGINFLIRSQEELEGK